MEERNILCGPKPLYPVEAETFGQQLYNSFLKYENLNKALVDAHTGESVSYYQLLKTSCHLAQCLEKIGLKQNSVISICSENSLFNFYPIIAAMYLGIIVSPINFNYSEREMEHFYNIIKPQIIFCSKLVFNKVAELKSNLSFVKNIIILDSSEGIDEGECLSKFISQNCDTSLDFKAFKPYHFDWDDQVAVILCSSGTTGLPKAVMLSHKNMVTRCSNCSDSNATIGGNAKPEQTALAFLPFFHVAGFVLVFEFLIKGLKTIILKRFDQELFLKSVQDFKVEYTSVVPTALIYLIKNPLIDKYDLSSLKEIIIGGDSLSKEIQNTATKRFNLGTIRQGYGLTECTLTVSLMPRDGFRIGSSGKLTPYLCAKIVDPATKTIMGHNNTGEIFLKGDVIMKGYFGNEEATKNAFDTEGWYKTGDHGYFDEDGYIYIVGRLKELIKYKGYQVSPTELQDLLRENPYIKDAAVFGIPDEEVGELPAAFVVLQPGKELTEKEVQDFISAQVSSAKRLRGGIRFIDDIPKHATGKPDRLKLPALFEKLRLSK